MHLRTHCPHCGWETALTREQLRQWWPEMACPRCNGRFDPLGGLLVELPRATQPLGGQHEPSPAAPTPPLRLAPSAAVAPAQAPRVPQQRWGWVLGSLVLLLGALAQAAWWNRGPLIRSPLTRPLIEWGYQQAGATAPLPQLPDQLVVTERHLEPHPEKSRRWQLRLGLSNPGVFPQALPVIDLELYDIRQHLTAAGRFLPVEYARGGLPDRIEVGGNLDLRLDLAALPEDPSGFRLYLR